MRNLPVYRVAAILAALGLLLFGYKWLLLGLPLRATKIANAWQIEVDARFTARGGPVNASVFLPTSDARQTVHDLRLIATGYGTSLSDEGVNRKAFFAVRNVSGEQAVHVRFIVQRFPERQQAAIQAHQTHTPLLVPSTAGSESPTPPRLSEAETAAAQSMIASARRRSANDVTMVTFLIKSLTLNPPGETARVLIGDNRRPSNIARISAAALVLGGFDARVVHGVDVAKPGRISDIVSWIEVLIGNRWRSFSVQTGEAKLPPGYIAWWRGTEPLVSVDGGSRPTRRIAIQRLRQSELDQVLTRGRRADTPLIVYSLHSLPTSSQELYKILMMVPIGVFILVILRNLVGIKGLGTFMPVLIALAFRETTLMWGLILFTSLVSVGLITRLYLEYLKLLIAPRLAVILMIVLLLMAIISVIAHKLGFDRGLSVALFPIVIMTMVIERVSTIWDERGAAAAVREAVQSLVIASLCYSVMSLPQLQHIFFTFPELVLVLLAGTLLIGRYSGYRLLELPRFRVLAGGKS